MSKGKARVNYLGRAGLVASADAPDWSFIYETSTVKHPKWNIGDVVELPDGRGFVYCKSSGPCYTGLGNCLFNAIPATGIDYANNVAADAAVGAKSVVITNGATVAQTEDGLRGGTILLKQLTGSDDTALQCRGIIGNTAAAKSANCTIYLDAPLTGALTTSSYAYCMPSPYSSVKWLETVGQGGMCSHVGVAATYVSAANVYHWEQFKGRVMGLSCQGSPGSAGDEHKRELVWRYQGSVQFRGTTAVTGLNEQVAGYIMDNNIAGNGATEIMLTGNI